MSEAGIPLDSPNTLRSFRATGPTGYRPDGP